jgi:8-oxo-dGTP pyrophosphatase MutT (NUDIX family)
MSATPISKLPNFDPRRVPVSAVDLHLPAVPPDRLSPEALIARFQSPPTDWQPEVVREIRFAERAPARAAVLIPIILHRAPGDLTILLTERTAHLSTHSGQIAFPGGKVDPTDASVEAAALREAHEEVGLDPAHVRVIGTLPTYVTGTSFIITPVVGLVSPGFDLRPNPDEVADAFEVPVGFLMNPANHRHHTFDWDGVRREWFSMPYRTGEGSLGAERFIWGATAGMLRNFYRFLSA